MLYLNNIYVQFNKKGRLFSAVDGIEMAVSKQEKVGIIGESGSGKTQTALSVMALIEGEPGLVGGEIWLNGEKLYSNHTNIDNYSNKNNKTAYLNFEDNIKKYRGNKVTMIFQDARASLVPYIKIKEQAVETWYALGYKDKTKLNNRLEYLIGKMNFNNADAILNSYPNQLSGGEAQRAYILLSLLGKPNLLIADEPTSSLDPVTSSNIIDLINDLSYEEGFSLLIISHSLDQIMKITDRIYVFLNGIVVEELIKNDKKFEEPFHPYTKFLFQMAEGKAFNLLRNSTTKQSIQNKYTKATQGCPYKNACKLRKELNSEKSKKCESIKPELLEIESGRKVACWAYEK